MSRPTIARDLWPLVEKLPHDEQVRLARLALRAAALGRSASAAYKAHPPTPEEFATDDLLAWETGQETTGRPARRETRARISTKEVQSR